MNEAGLYVGMYYFPGFADFSPYEPAQAGRSLSVGDFMQWMLSSFATVAEVRAHLHEVLVVEVVDPRFGGAHAFKFAAMPQTFNFPTQPIMRSLMGPRVWVGLSIALVAALTQIAFFLSTHV
jgi:hypothetical protein